MEPPPGLLSWRHAAAIPVGNGIGMGQHVLADGPATIGATAAGCGGGR